jgi:hypothetical protein
MSKQLARKTCSTQSGGHDTDDDDSSSASSLEIMPPVKKTSALATMPNGTSTSKSASSKRCAAVPKRISPDNDDSDSDSDDDDDDLLNSGATFARKPALAAPKKGTTATDKKLKTSKPPSTSTNTSREEARQCKKIETEERKRQEKLANAKKREQEKLEREQQKQQEKETKKRLNEETQQSKGRFAYQEIAILMDPDIYRSEQLSLVETLVEDFTLKEYPSLLICSQAIQWVRKDSLLGGAKEALECLEQNQPNHFELMDRIILILEPEEFIPLLRRTEHDEDDDYPALESWLTSLVSRWQTVWKTTKQPKFILLLHRIPEQLDRQWVEHRRNGRKNDPPPPTESELLDAIQWILIQFQVECVLCKSIEMIQSTVHKMTRAICEGPYKNQVSELECIKKIKTQSTNSDKPLDRARDTWLRQVQQVPRISEPMARNIVRHYPTAHSLFEAYHHHQEPANKENGPQLVSNIISDSKRREAKLSEQIYRLMTSTNPSEML